MKQLSTRHHIEGDTVTFQVDRSDREAFDLLLAQNNLWFSFSGQPPVGDPIFETTPWARLVGREDRHGCVLLTLDIAGTPTWALVTEALLDEAKALAEESPFTAVRVLWEGALDRGSSGLGEVRDILEAWGKDPKWLRVVGTKTGFERYPTSGPDRKVGNEVTVNIRGKDYWFPSNPNALKKFIALGRQNRGKALQWYRRYVRRQRGYKGKWPDRTYVMRNKILKKNTLDQDTRVTEREESLDEAILCPDTFQFGRILLLKHDPAPGEGKAERLTGLDVEQLREIWARSVQGQGNEAIASSMGIDEVDVDVALTTMKLEGDPR